MSEEFPVLTTAQVRYAVPEIMYVLYVDFPTRLKNTYTPEDIIPL